MNVDNMASKTIHFVSKLNDFQQKSKPSHLQSKLSFIRSVTRCAKSFEPAVYVSLQVSEVVKLLKVAYSNPGVIYFSSSSSTGIFTNSLSDQPAVGCTLHLYRGGHGFESRASLNNFQA